MRGHLHKKHNTACWSNIETINAVVAPAALGIVKYDYLRSRRGHRSFIVVEDTMDLCVGRYGWIDTGCTDEVCYHNNLW